MQSQTHDVTLLLQAVRAGDARAFERVWVLLYDELRALARRQLRREGDGQTLQATALVHEAYLKLASGADAKDRTHLIGIAARAMRQVLVDEARRRQASKRGGGWARTTLSGAADVLGVDPEQLLALDAALNKLEARQRQIVEWRYFGGLEESEIAELLGVSDRTVRREWVKARAWLYRELYPTP